jgi:transcriptional regulator with XRE-family HTH domain
MKTTKLLPRLQKKLDIVGENIKLARLRRKLTISQVAERAGISPMTLTRLEDGMSYITIGELINVLRAVNLENDFFNIASDDKLGRKLQDLELLSNVKKG